FLQGQPGLGMEQIDKLSDAKILVEGKAFVGCDGPAVVLLKESSNLARRFAVEPKGEKRPGGFGREIRNARRDDLVENLGFGRHGRGWHGRIIPPWSANRQPKL